MSTSRLARRPRHGLRVALCAALVASLAACAAPLPQPAPDAVPPVPPAAVTLEQSRSVLDQLSQVLSAADTALDPAALSSRVAGPALAIRTAEYVRSTATGGQKGPTALPTGEQALIVPQTDQWPRTQLVVTEQPDDLQAPRILVMRQESPRDQYHLWGWARLGQGVQMPMTADPGTGSPVLAADATGLLLTPNDVLTQYADVLTSGDGSAAAPQFAPDFFRTGIETARQTYTAAVESVGTVAETYTPQLDSVVALSTVDGGAIVVGQLTTVTTLTVSQGSLTLDPTDAALSGKPSVTANLTYTWADVLVFYVPPAGAAAQVQLLAGEHARVSVSGE
ncbi:hypothetical protein ACTHAM_000363 [Cellulomonas soli]|uniref:hypothetical protein n=1 Tax=Cellulomonas soli TaxID=931535 RepID=UPI003F840B7B